MSPNRLVPAMACPFTRSAVMPNTSSTRTAAATATGSPTTSAMKTVRRDHSISPTDRSNTRHADAQ